MKIISEVPEGSVLVKMTLNELANVTGFSNYHSSGFMDTIREAIKKETIIPVSVIYKQHEAVTSILREPEYYKARTKLNDMLQALTPIEGLFQIIKDTREKEEKDDKV